MRVSDWSSDVCSSDLLGHGSAVAIAGCRECVDGSAEQTQEMADISRRCLVAAFLTASCPREQRADKLVEHADRGVCEPGLEVERDRRQRRAAAVLRVVRQQECRSSEERRVGKEGVRKCRSRWSAYPLKKESHKQRSSRE